MQLPAQPGITRIEDQHGSFERIRSDKADGVVKVIGNVNNVLRASIERKDVCLRHPAEIRYSIGLGALGDQIEDCYPKLGEMITVDGNMYCLPADGKDSPDCLRFDKGVEKATIKTAFNVSVSGGFDDLILFKSSEKGGTNMASVYRSLFDMYRSRRPDYKGVIGVVARAQMSGIYGSAVKISPVKDFAPKNGEMITDASNVSEWFELDKEPRHKDVTALICGVGVDLTADLSAFSKDRFNAVFYVHPANIGAKTELLHEHAVIFSAMPLPEKAASLEAEIRGVIENGRMIDMRHILDNSTVTGALIGVSYIQEFLLDDRCPR
ncbi:MAG: hypothetical protein AB1714_30170 [Acidobacteriota bacterium]